MKYYVIETTCTGPENPANIFDCDTYAITNDSPDDCAGYPDPEDCESVWTNRYSAKCIHECSSIEEARKFLVDLFEDLRPVHLPDRKKEDSYLEVFKPGKFPQMSEAMIGNWLQPWLEDVKQESKLPSDAELQKLAVEFESEANNALDQTFGDQDAFVALLIEERDRLAKEFAPFIFTQENSDGFSDAEIAIMNAALAKLMRDYDGAINEIPERSDELADEICHAWAAGAETIDELVAAIQLPEKST